MAPNPTQSKDNSAWEDPDYLDNLRKATWASCVGSALEYYDFALYGLAAALIFGRLFFPELGASAGIAAGFATYAVGFMARPLGGIFFGALGDRLGRKAILIITIALMGGSTTLIGILPTGQTIGIAAPILLVLLRVLQGLGAGAEQAGATVLMAEYAPPNRRGYVASLPFVGIMVGIIIASGVFFLLGIVNEQVVMDWLWRVPFLLSTLLISVAVYVRMKMKESPTFVKLERQEQVANHPTRDAFKFSLPSMLRGIGLRMAENGSSAIYQTLAVSFITNIVGIAPWKGPLAIAIGAALSVFIIPFAGALSDRYGRMRIYRIGAIVQWVLAIPAWALMAHGSSWMIIPVLAITYAFSINIMLGAQCAALPELFGNRNRYICVAITREFSAVIAGGIAPFIGTLLLALFANSWVPLALYVMVLATLTIWATFTTPETKGRDLGETDDAFNNIPSRKTRSTRHSIGKKTPVMASNLPISIK
ncbi:putative transporter YdfJ [Halomonadaceae bacterium LMG 33818]|uniref:MFS transporter n=1 Tax=Cernens ardua TaxID=3402176 RepID=UPI003EDBC6D7